ncbi:MAG: host-nuclease inhibitor Gam family protein [Zoogloeaceae bacterium]|jgi:phage host-nuclease inhibitor protein Gam|nr:host-nuclease inhibitor Gam family protein [Zoogloeaceae bacterium]
MAKAKKTAAVYVCQSKEETMTAIRELGDAQRELTRLETAVNDAIARIVEAEKDRIEALKARRDTLTEGIQMWCEANRAQLCANGGKTANLITGEVAWRQNPPSVSVRQADKVVETLRALKLDRFLREKIEVSKDAILADPKAVSGIAGITVVTGVETFAVTPFEVEVVE